MRIETIVANILVDVTREGRLVASKITDDNDRKLYATAYQAALDRVAARFGQTIEKVTPEIREMEVLE